MLANPYRPGFQLTGTSATLPKRAIFSGSSLVDASWEQTISRVLTILVERKKAFAGMRPDVTSLIGLRQIEQFLHHGLVGRLGLPPGVQLERKLAARREVAHIVDFLKSNPLGIRIGIVSDNMPSETFQIFEEAEEASVAVSPFRLGGAA